MKQRFAQGGLAAWSIRHPLGVVMLTLSLIVFGAFSLQNLRIDLLPAIVTPDVLVRINDPGVAARIMEDSVTRQLEEQLAITEGAIAIRSRTSEGRSAVDLSFPYGSDIDKALRDASIRLDRAKRFLPPNDKPPIIYKRDPSQIPVMELVVSSYQRDPVALRDWVDYQFSRWFINLPGVASLETGGGLEREIQIVADQDKLAVTGLSLPQLAERIEATHRNEASGRIDTGDRLLASEILGEVERPQALLALPLAVDDAQADEARERSSANDRLTRLQAVADVIDGHRDAALRIRLNGVPGVKVSVQKQPEANTVGVVDEVRNRLRFLRQQRLLPDDIQLAVVGDQSGFIRSAMSNAASAALSGALLAMLVTWLFLGNLQRTLIIGAAIPVAVCVTFILMSLFDLSLNIMTLGGLALGMGLLIDSTIVMLENISRHRQAHEAPMQAALAAAAEVNSPIVASTSTNLAALLPFLFIGGLSGLLFRDLILTLCAAMLAALMVALTLVPALGASRRLRVDAAPSERLFTRLQNLYQGSLAFVLRHPLPLVLLFILALGAALFSLHDKRSIYLPRVDEGIVSIYITGERGVKLDETDAAMEKIEALLMADERVESLFTTAGGFVFGRSEYINPNRGSIKVQLIPAGERGVSSAQWLQQTRRAIDALGLVGFRIQLRVNSVRGIRTSDNDDDISLHIQGEDLDTLRTLANEAVELLRDMPGISNPGHSYEDLSETLQIRIDRERARRLGVDTASLARALRIATQGERVSQWHRHGRAIDIRLRLPRADSRDQHRLRQLLIGQHDGKPVYLGDVARIETVLRPARIVRYQQQRIVEINASYQPGVDHEKTLAAVMQKLGKLKRPEGYRLYDNHSNRTLVESRHNSYRVLALAVFLVLVVMAVQYESLRNPLIILLSIPFTLTGVAIGFACKPQLPLSMPVWLGLIMLVGIVVNNAIVLVEQIERLRDDGLPMQAALLQAGKQRLRPILMTTLTTVFGMLPLALGLGDGAEMLQPLAFVIVWGLSFSMLVSLLLAPVLYRLFHPEDSVARD